MPSCCRRQRLVVSRDINSPQRDIFRPLTELNPGQQERAREMTRGQAYRDRVRRFSANNHDAAPVEIPLRDLFPDLMPAEAAARVREIVQAAARGEQVAKIEADTKSKEPDHTVPLRKIEI